MNIKLQNIVFLLLAAFLLTFCPQAQARQFEPGEFVSIGYVGDKTGNLRSDIIYRGSANDEIRFIDVETNKIIYSRTFDNNYWYPQDYFSPDGKTLYLLWQAQSSSSGQITKKIELFDVYNAKLIQSYEVRYGDECDVQFSLCSNVAYVAIASPNAIGDKWSISYSFIDVKGNAGIIKSSALYSKCFPPHAFIQPDGRNIRLWTCDSGDVLTYPLPNPASSIPNDPDPVMPSITVIPEGIVDGAAASQSFKTLTSLAMQALSSLVQPSTFPTIKYAVRVIGSDKRPILGLGTGNFQVKEDSIAQSPITVEFQSGNAPISVALCLDTSGSISDGELSEINAAANNFVDLFGSSDRGAIFKFSTNVRLIQGFTQDKATLKNAINASPPERGVTSLNDAVYDAISLCRQESNRKAVVVLTDGYDNDSNHSLQQIIDYSRENKIPVFTIGLGSPLNVVFLQNIANGCGGIYFHAASTTKLGDVFNKVSEDIRSRYLVTYTTNNPKKNGATRSVETTATNGGNSASGTFQYRAPQGTIPIAQILSITPNPVGIGQPVTFKGIGTDSDGTVVAYSWRSSINGVIGNQETFQTSGLSEGDHTIYFKVKDTDDLWSNEVSTTLIVSSKVTVTGKIQYENKIFNEIGTGDPNTIEFKPVRFAKIEIIRDSDQAVLGTNQTNNDGTFSIEVKASINDRIYLKCYANQENTNYNIRVVNSQSNMQSASSDSKQFTGSSISFNLDITEAKNAGAFNILDTIMLGSDKVNQLSNSVPPLITVKWGKGITLETGYLNSTIDLNGSLDDPDEYDDSVILHEYGHFIMDKFSCDKSPGGVHSSTDTNQDIRLSWSEGWADYFSSIVRNNSKYLDIVKDPQTGLYILRILDLETLFHNKYGTLVNTATGQDTEVAVSAILWDIYDSNNDNADTLSLSSQPIWNVFCNFGSYHDCVMEDFYQLWFNLNGESYYKTEINNIFAERKVFYSNALFKRGKIFTKSDGRTIPDGTGQSLSSDLAIADNLSVINLNVFVDLPHKNKSDLIVKLISPSNKQIVLHNLTGARPGQSYDIFAWYQPPYETIPDEGLTALDKFKGENTQGNWILNVTDTSNIGGNTGILNRWKLEIFENQPPEIDLIGDKVVDEGKLLEFNISAKDPNNQTLAYSVTGIPQGAYFSPEKRLFSWMPNYNQQGVYTVHFEVTDGSLKDSEDVKIIVNDVTTNPVSGESVNVGLKVRVIQ